MVFNRVFNNRHIGVYLRAQGRKVMRTPSDLRTRDNSRIMRNGTPSDLRGRKISFYAPTPSDLRRRKRLTSPLQGEVGEAQQVGLGVCTHTRDVGRRRRAPHTAPYGGPGRVQHGQAFSRTRARECETDFLCVKKNALSFSRFLFPFAFPFPFAACGGETVSLVAVGVSFR